MHTHPSLPPSIRFLASGSCEADMGSVLIIQGCLVVIPDPLAAKLLRTKLQPHFFTTTRCTVTEYFSLHLYLADYHDHTVSRLTWLWCACGSPKHYLGFPDCPVKRASCSVDLALGYNISSLKPTSSNRYLEIQSITSSPTLKYYQNMAPHTEKSQLKRGRVCLR